MLVAKQIEIDMGHRVTNHKSKCASLHGHRYKIEVGVNDKIITISGDSSEGMVIDFGDLKQIMMVIDKKYDHGLVLWEKDSLVEVMRADSKTKLVIVPFVPTVENLARHWFGLLLEKLKEQKITLVYVKVWETPTSFAVCTCEDMVVM